MELAKVLTQLRAELKDLDAAIACLERIEGGGRRRGRPPAYLVSAKRSRPKRKRRTSNAAGSPKMRD
ncbi:MAG: hypothetical protein C5B51_01215 [Terriglobia bacterium]|nr:MAG: hypothetical protein C5B51_01215 [Terriglobia bacterium]